MSLFRSRLGFHIKAIPKRDLRSGQPIEAPTQEERLAASENLGVCVLPTGDKCRYQKALPGEARCLASKLYGPRTHFDCPHLRPAAPFKVRLEDEEKKREAEELLIESPPDLE